MKPRLRIGIDLDDVAVDFMTEFTRICNEMFGKPEIGARAADWEWSNFGLTQEQIGLAWEKIKQTYDFWTDLPVEVQLDREKLAELDRNHDLFFITARVQTLGPSVQWQACWWLQNKIGIYFPTVLVSSDKGPLAAALKLDFFIDDRPKNCVEVKRARPECRVFVKDSSHNQDFVDPTIPRVKDLNAFISIVEDENGRSQTV